MPSLTVENYLKAILQIEIKTDDEQRVSTGVLAEEMNVAPGTVTSMLKTLSESRLATYKPYEGVSLTPAGRSLALRMVRRHRLIELFLVKTLNLSWDQVHDEAENMEHAVSDFVVDRIDAYLGHPTSDPHGSPIPGTDGAMRGDEEATIPLSDCAPATRVRFVRVVNQGNEFLRLLSEAGFEIGGEGIVSENNVQSGVVTTNISNKPLTISREAAETIRVVMVPEAV
ncbi:MAG: metal-dependent transcriptional regulator [Planctomycetaceae bacterium]